jgi:N-acetylmuramidase
MITKSELLELSESFGIPVPSIQSIIEVESAGQGFDKATGKIKIQFEPHWFKRLSRLFGGLWSVNKVDVQSKEWLAFNDAFAKNPNKAMESTSWGSMQVMGFHFKRLGFKSVGELVEFAKKSERNQVWLGLMFLKTDKVIYQAILKKDWKTVAYRYNGANYKINKYDTKLERAEMKYSNIKS